MSRMLELIEGNPPSESRTRTVTVILPLTGEEELRERDNLTPHDEDVHPGEHVQMPEPALPLLQTPCPLQLPFPGQREQDDPKYPGRHCEQIAPVNPKLQEHVLEPTKHDPEPLQGAGEEGHVLELPEQV